MLGLGLALKVKIFGLGLATQGTTQGYGLVFCAGLVISTGYISDHVLFVSYSV